MRYTSLLAKEKFEDLKLATNEVNLNYLVGVIDKGLTGINMLNSAPIKIKCNRLLMLGSLLACILMTGCALTPTVANIEIPEVANPKSGPAVRIVSVEDGREFVYPFKDCDTPSVPNAEALKNQELKARSFARKGRCGGGETTMHEMMLIADDQTVSNKIAQVVGNAFKESGFKTSFTDSSNGEFLAVKIKVLKSWADMGVLEDIGLRNSAWQKILVQIGEDAPVEVSVAHSQKTYVSSGSGMTPVVYGDSLKEVQRILAERLRALVIKSAAN